MINLRSYLKVLFPGLFFLVFCSISENTIYSKNIVNKKKIKPIIVLEDQNRPSLSFDGSRLVASPEIGLSEVFEINTSKKLGTFAFKDSESQAISADGKRVRIFGGKFHTTYDIDSGERLLDGNVELIRDGKPFGWVKVMGDGGLNTKNISFDLNLVASAFFPKTWSTPDYKSPGVILGNLENNSLVQEFRTDDGFVFQDDWWRVSMTPDGNYVAASRFNSDDKRRNRTVVWESKTGKVIFSLLFHSHWLSFSDNGKKLVTKNSGDDEKIECWDVLSGKLIATLSEKVDGRKIRISNGVISPDGKILVTLGNKEFYFWDIETGKFITSQRQDEYSEGIVTSATFSGDSKRIAIGSNTEVVTVWSVDEILRSGKQIAY